MESSAVTRAQLRRGPRRSALLSDIAIYWLEFGNGVRVPRPQKIVR
jgi:hypothetical protein